MRRLALIRVRLPWLAVLSVALLAAASLLTAVPLVARAQSPSTDEFPINEPFRSDTFNNPNWELTGSAQLTNQGNGWLELTPATGTKSGAAVLDDAYPSDLGIVVQFQYATFGGTGADGFSFFLVDGSFPASTGGSGGGLGYTNGTNASGTGIRGGYVGVAFDEYGNFSAPVTLPSGATGSGPGKRANTIAVRGTEQRGFPYLAGATPPGGTIETGNDTTGVRTVRITIIDNPDGLPILNVFSNAGDSTPLEHVITDLELDAPLPPTFKLGFAASTGGSTNIHEIRDLTVGVPADLSVDKQCPLQVMPGGSIRCVLTVNGNGPSALTDGHVRDVVPDIITGVQWRCVPVAGSGGVCGTPSSGTGNDITAPVTFPNNHGVGEVRIIITGTVSRSATDGTVITNTATVELPPDRILAGATGHTSTSQTEVEGTAETGSADLEIDKTVDNPHPEVGQDVTFTVTVTNNGPDPTTFTIVRDQLPGGLDYVSDDSADTHTTYEEFGGVWDAGPLGAGDSRTLYITASAQAKEPVTNQVSFAESDLPDPTPCLEGSAEHCGPAVTVSPRYTELEETKTATPATTTVGGLVTFHLSVTNKSDEEATGVIVTDKLPPQVTYISDDSGGAYDPATGNWLVGDLAVGETRTLNIRVRVNATSDNAITSAVDDEADPTPCLPAPGLPEPQVTRPYGCPNGVLVTVIMPVTG